MPDLILASTSAIRRQLLDQARVPHQVQPARVDEAMIKAALMAEGASAHDLADALAEAKAQKIANNFPTDYVLGCDQVLFCEGKVFSKASDPQELQTQLVELSGKTHLLFSAVVLYSQAKPVWRHVGRVRMSMHELSPDWIAEYVARNWDSVRYCVGGYQIEAEGVRLFSKIEGDHFSILGLPLIPLLDVLKRHEVID